MPIRTRRPVSRSDLPNALPPQQLTKLDTGRFIFEPVIFNGIQMIKVHAADGKMIIHNTVEDNAILIQQVAR